MTKYIGGGQLRFVESIRRGTRELSLYYCRDLVGYCVMQRDDELGAILPAIHGTESEARVTFERLQKDWLC